tara:strand:- start:15 stop:341 length:327 start_codon:yes stop_codon:yes gene_type:complete
LQAADGLALRGDLWVPGDAALGLATVTTFKTFKELSPLLTTEGMADERAHFPAVLLALPLAAGSFAGICGGRLGDLGRVAGIDPGWRDVWWFNFTGVRFSAPAVRVPW